MPDRLIVNTLERTVIGIVPDGQELHPSHIDNFDSGLFNLAEWPEGADIEHLIVGLDGHVTEDVAAAKAYHLDLLERDRGHESRLLEDIDDDAEYSRRAAFLRRKYSAWRRAISDAATGAAVRAAMKAGPK